MRIRPPVKTEKKTYINATFIYLSGGSGYGTKKSIPQMILAVASCDDIFVIILFSTFSGMAPLQCH